MLKRKSKYSDSFDFFDDFAKCKFCPKIAKMSKKSGTNSLRHHLKLRHPTALNQIEADEADIKMRRQIDVDKASIQPFFSLPITDLTTEEVKPVFMIPNLWEENDDTTEERSIELAIIKMISIDCMPLKTVEREGFRHFLSIVCPKFSPKSLIFYASYVLPLLEQMMRNKIADDLKSMTYLSIASDSWSSKCNKHHLLSVGAHWIDSESFTPQSCILASPIIYGTSVDASNYSDRIKCILNSYGVPTNKVTCMVRDGTKMMQSLSDKLKLESINCFSNMIQMCVVDVFYSSPNVQSLLLKLKKIVRKVRKSLKNCLSELQNENELPERMLLEDTEVRWTSLLKMLVSFLSAKTTIDYLNASSDPDSDSGEDCFPKISDDEWNLMASVKAVIEPLADIATHLQHRFNSTASVIIPCLQVYAFKNRKMRQTIENYIDDGDESIELHFLKEINEAMHFRGMQYMENEKLKMATFVDPRFKDSYFPCSFKDKVIHKIKLNNGLIDVKSEAPTTFCDSIFEEYLLHNSRCSSIQNSESDNDEVTKEIENYLSTPPSTSIDPFTFWSCHNEFPNLKKLALELLSIPATSSETERLFSVSEMILTENRNRTKAETVETMVFCNLNSKIYGVNSF